MAVFLRQTDPAGTGLQLAASALDSVDGTLVEASFWRAGDPRRARNEVQASMLPESPFQPMIPGHGFPLISMTHVFRPFLRCLRHTCAVRK